MSIRSAVVLAAGKGTRLSPLTDNRPKPMLPAANKPLLEHVVESLADAGIERVVLIVGYRRERIQNHFGNGDDWGVDIEYAFQNRPRGTGDALLQAESLIGSDFVAMNGDRIVDAELIRRLIDRRETTGDSCIAVTRVEDPSQYGVVELDGDLVADITEKPPPYAVSSRVVNAGVYAFGPEIFAAVRDTEYHGELALTDTLSQMLPDHPLRAVRYTGTWLELSEPWDLLTINDGILGEVGMSVAADAQVSEEATVTDPAAVGSDAHLQPGARLLRGTAIGDNVWIGANAVITNCVILPDATIEAGAVLTDCVVGAGAHVGPNATAEGGATDVVVDGTHHRDVRFGGLIGDRATLGGNVTIERGAILGNEVDIGGGSAVSGSIPSGTRVRRG
ncbi:MAG: sugar phosphate nucleotidyltransferase [Salinigranum sp.]